MFINPKVSFLEQIVQYTMSLVHLQTFLVVLYDLTDIPHCVHCTVFSTVSGVLLNRLVCISEIPCMFNNVIYFTALDLVKSLHNNISQVIFSWLFLLAAPLLEVYLCLIAVMVAPFDLI